jgi:hypothetical protein
LQQSVSPAGQPGVIDPPSLQSQVQLGSLAGQEQTQPVPASPAPLPSQVHWPSGRQTAFKPVAHGGSGPVQMLPASAQSQVQVGSLAGQEQPQTAQGWPLGTQAPLQRYSPEGQPVPPPPSQAQAQSGWLSGQAQEQPMPPSGLAGQAIGQAELSGMQLPTLPQPQKYSLAGQQTAAGAVPAGSFGQLTTQLWESGTQLPLPFPQPQKYWPAGQQLGGGGVPASAMQTWGQAWVSEMQEPWPLQPQKYSLAGQQTDTGAGPASTGGIVPASQSQVQVGELAGQAHPQPPAPPEGWAGQFTTQAVVSGRQLPVPLPQPQRYWPAGQQPPPPPLEPPLLDAPPLDPPLLPPIPPSAMQIAGQPMPGRRQTPLPLQPQKVSFGGQAGGPALAPKRVKPAAVKERVFALASMVRSALPMANEGVLLVSLSTPTTVNVLVVVPAV